MGQRYGRLPHELIGSDFQSTDPYVIYCFNEAVAMAGSSRMPKIPKDDTQADEYIPTKEELLLQGGKKVRLPHPQGSAIMGHIGGVPYISGRVPIVRKKKL